MKSYVEVRPDGTMIVGGRSVEVWVRENVTPCIQRSDCAHAPMDNPRHPNVCRKCGRRI